MPGKSLPALILAGGKSSRMGQEKSLLWLGDNTILGHIVRRLTPQVSALYLNAPHEYPGATELHHLPDTLDGHLGPLAGILSGLKHIEKAHPLQTHLLTVPSDSPFLPTDLARKLMARMKEGTIVVATSAGRDHPVFGLWPVALADDLQKWLQNPMNRRIHDFLRRHPYVAVDFPLLDTTHGPLDPFLNINTPDDFELAQAFAGELQ
jgi:molybdopterin-guanine dinucleotide biosynthesis protein A